MQLENAILCIIEESETADDDVNEEDLVKLISLGYEPDMARYNLTRICILNKS